MPKLTDKHVETEISEIFSSLQGEGPYLGVPQIFLRFGRCNMHCGYCDELEKMREEKFSIFSLETLLGAVDALESQKGRHHSVSLTGGEPLFYTPFLKNFLPKLKEKGYTIYLETNGTLSRELESVIRFIDIIAMDLKPASSTGDRDFWREHEAFLKIALQKEVFVKVVITPTTTRQDVERCIELMKSVQPNIPFIFQPLSEAFGMSVKSLQLIESEFIELAKKDLTDVRVIGQLHKVWGVR